MTHFLLHRKTAGWELDTILNNDALSRGSGCPFFAEESENNQRVEVRLDLRAGQGDYLVSTGMVVSEPSFLARNPMALILAPGGTTNSTMPRLLAVTA